MLYDDILEGKLHLYLSLNHLLVNVAGPSGTQVYGNLPALSCATSEVKLSSLKIFMH